jgi:hypothetical protein
MRHIRSSILAVSGLALAIGGCGTIRRAAQLKALQEELVLAESEMPSDDGTVPSVSSAAVMPFTPASKDVPPRESAGPSTPAPAPSDGGELTKECPVDFERFPASMSYCPEHGTRLRDLSHS